MGLASYTRRKVTAKVWREAKATYKIDKTVLVNCERFEKYLETFREV
jgi:hypothetical protein